VPEGGQRVLEVRDASGPISLTDSYDVAANSFIAAGGDNFTVFTSSSDQLGGPLDLDALIEYLATLPQPLAISVEGRIERN
jgi:5'-nucleotidase